MKQVLFIALILITAASLCGQPYPYEWKTTKATIDKEHHLYPLLIDGLQRNLVTFLGDEEASKLLCYVVDEMKMQTHCGVDMFSVMGFYDESLVFYFLATEEMPFSEDDTTGDCLRASLFQSECDFLWKPILKMTAMDGDIFFEGGMCGLGENQSSYLVEVHSLGLLSNPRHLQFTMFLLDKQYLDDVLQTKMNIHDDRRKTLHPATLFFEYIVDDYDTLQIPAKE